MPLDLVDGDEDLADASPQERRAAARRAAEAEKPKKPRSSRSTAAKQQNEEAELGSRLDRTLDRVAVALEQRGDDELATIVREDASAMAQGLISLTRSAKFLRNPLLMSLNLIEPILAFGRITRVLYVRLAERQARVAWERETQAQQAADQGTEPSPVGATA